MLSINKLKLPVRLIHPDMDTIELVDNIDYLNYQTRLGVMEKSLLNCFIDNDGKFYEIVEMIEKGKKGPWWRFDFFNPMMKIELKFSLVEDNFVLEKLKIHPR